MPKRTNEFQQLIKFIYDNIVCNGGTVTESALIDEKDNSSKREVDILIKNKVGGHEISIAIECRDRSRKDDITWIDDLIGKYINLKIDKVIAVSKSGFASPAKTKANTHDIETLTLEEAKATDWNEKFFKLFLHFFDEHYKIVGVIYNFKNNIKLDNNTFYKSDIFINDVKIKNFEKYSNKMFVKDVRNFLISNRKKIYDYYIKEIKTTEKELIIPIQLFYDNFYIMTPKNQKIIITDIIYKIKMLLNIDEVLLNHYNYNKDYQVSTGQLKNNNSSLNFKLLQNPEKGSIHINVINKYDKN